MLCLLLTAVALAGVCWNGFTSWDDPHTLASNPWMVSPSIEAFIRYWRHPAMDLYIPMTYTLWLATAAVGSWLAGFALSQPNPHLFHTLNLLVHLIATGMVFAILLKLFERPWAAFAGAMVFAVHPVQVEAVAWASGLKDVLAGMLSLASIWLVICRVKQPKIRVGESPWKSGWYLLALLAYAGALLAKPSAVVTPLLLVVLGRWALRISWRRLAGLLWPWVALAIPCVIWTKLAQPAVVVAAASPIYARPLVACDALGFYLLKLIWPVQLCVDYGRTPMWVMSHGWKQGLWAIPILVVVGLWFYRRRFPFGLCCGAIFLAALTPVLGLVRFDFQHYSTVADHYLYLPMLGVAVGLAALVIHLGQRRGWVWPGAGAAVVLMALSIAQVRHWRDTPALFTQVLRVNPQSWAAHNSLSAWWLLQGEAGRARIEAQAAVNLNPASAPAWVDLGAAMALLNDLDGAQAAYRRAIEANPNDAAAHAAMGGLLGQLGRLADARRHCLAAIALDPRQPTAYLNLGTIEAAQENWPDARRLLAKAVDLAPRDVRARTNYAIALSMTGDTPAAVEQLKLALRIDPNFPPARQTLRQLESVEQDASKG